MVATTVRVEGGRWARLPVRTREAVPKAEVLALCRALHALTLTAPVALGAVVLADALGTGVDVGGQPGHAPAGVSARGRAQAARSSGPWNCAWYRVA